jgi:NAD(P)H-flavin reductase
MSMALQNSAGVAESLADPMLPRIARVAAVRQEIPEVATLDLIPDGDGAGFEPFAPGQFNMLTVFGVGESAISVSGDAADQGRLIHTIRAVGAVSNALTRLRPGDALGVRGPFGVGWPMAEADGQDVVIVAGGLGLAPLRPAIYHLLAHRERFGRIALLYGTRSPEQILFRDELETWRRRLDVDVDVTVDHAEPSWRGNVGVVTRLISRASFDPLSSIAFVCGPEVMMRFSIMTLREAEMPDEAIYLSMERNMKCAIGLCGHCQFGPTFICKDGPVFRHDKIRHLLPVKEL